MAGYTKRRPSPRLLFHTKKERDFGIGADFAAAFPTFPARHITRITTSNAMGNASGSFGISLVYWKMNPDDVQPYYYEKIKPLDLVEIELEPGITTMMGIVDKVSKSTTIGPKNVNQSVEITGRSLGAIWEFDLIKYFTNALGLSPSMQERNLFLQQGEELFEFMGQPPYDAVKAIFEHLPMFDMEVFGRKTVSEFLDVGSELFCRKDEKIFARGISPYSGRVWDYYKTYIQEPFNELWTDSKDGKLFIRCRPTPFSHGDHDPEESVNPLGETRKSSWHDIKNWIDGKPHHVIWPEVIRDEKLSVDHASGYSVFTVVSSDKFTGADSEYSTFHPLVDSPLVEEIGTRDRQIALNYIPLVGDGETNDSSLERYEYYRNKLYLWNRDNHRMESGTMTIRGNSNIRVGDKVHRHFLDTDFYVTAVMNTWAFGQPYVTQISVDRGLRRDIRNDLYKAGMDFLKGI